MLGLLAAAVASPARANDALPPSLESLLRSASLVVEGRVVRVDEGASSALSLAWLEVRRVHKGRSGPAEGALPVVEARRSPSLPATLAPGAEGVLFLAPAESSSALRARLAGRAGVVWQLAGERWGFVPAAAGVSEAVAGWAALGRGAPTDAAPRERARRVLVFGELASDSARLAADAAHQLPRLAGLAEDITPGEQETLSAALRRVAWPLWVRRALVVAVGRARLATLVPALRAAGEADPELLGATWAVRRSLGGVGDVAEWRSALRSASAAARAAAARELGTSGEPQDAARLGALAVADPEPRVVKAAVQGLARLAASQDPAADAALGEIARAFADGGSHAHQAAAAALYEVGGERAADALVELAFEGPERHRAQAAALLMTLGLPPDDPRLARVRSEHPDDAVRRLATEGFEGHHH